MVVGTAEALDPLRGLRRASGTRSTRGICPYATSRTSTWRNANSFSPLTAERRSRRTRPLRSSECSARSSAAGSRPASDAAAAGPEHLAEHRRVLEQALLLGREAVEPSGDDALDRLRERQVVGGAALDVEPRELLGIQRVAAGRSRSTCCVSAGSSARSSTRAMICAASSSASGESAERRRIQLAAAPTRAPVEQLGARGADDEERYAGRPIGEMVDEVEQAVVGPVEVLEYEDERALLGERLRGNGARRANALARCSPSSCSPPISGSQAAASTQRAIVAGTALVDASPHSFCRATSSGSFSWMPACAFTISLSAQKVTPSPYGSAAALAPAR